MYVNQQISMPNYYQMDQLPFLRIDTLNMESGLSAKRMLSVRNITYKYQNILSKIFVYWPKFQVRQQQVPKIYLLCQLPITNIDNLTYIAAQLNKKQQISQYEWNSLISMIQKFKQEANKIVDSILMIQYQIKMTNSKNVWQNVYYSVQDDCFRLKISFKSLGFEISPLLKKNKVNLDFKQGFVISNHQLVMMLKEKLHQKLLDLNKKNYHKQFVTKSRAKIQNFYDREIKKIDQNLLSLKLKYNFPVLRQKRFIPIQFIDGLNRQRLAQRIFSNKNKNCMYGHFIGYNVGNYQKLQNTFCERCGIQIKQLQQNKLLMYLRENIFNPCNNSIMYSPQFNRFKIITPISQLQLTKRKMQMLQLSKDKDAIQQQNVPNNSMQEDNNNNSQMKNQQDSNNQNENKIQDNFQFINYMHLCSTVKSMYPNTKSRVKSKPKKPVQYVNFIYTLQLNNSTNNNKITRPQTDKYFLSFELSDPCRGRYCNHLQFADLRLFYKNRVKKPVFSHYQYVYICPICNEQIKDTQLMYLKQTLVLIKFIKKLLQPQKSFMQQQTKKKVINKNSIKIKINNVQSKIFIEYLMQDSNNNMFRKCEDCIDKFYSTLVDPYIPFSEYALGVQKKSKRLQAMYNFQNEGDGQEEAICERLEAEWFGIQDNNLII